MFQGRQPTNAEIASLLGLGRAPAPSMARPQFSFPAPRFVPTGTIKPTPKTIAGSIQATIAKGLQKVGMGERRAHQFAARTVLPLTDATPVGNVTGAEEGKNTFKRGLTKGDLGTMALGAGSFLLSAAPLPGAIKRGGKKLGTGMFGSMLRDKGGAIRAWHGSPHDFDKFEWSPRTRGTGEGAQAYGDGLYFAENPKVAMDYQRQLAGLDWKAPERAANYHPNTLTAIKKDLVHNPVSYVLDMNRQYSELAKQTGERSIMADMFDALDKGDIGPGGRLYEVNINAEPEDFLDWDAPVPGVTSRLEGFPVIDAWKHNGAAEHVSGQTLYRHLADGLTRGAHLRGAPMNASQKLKELGLPGIRFLDQGSRAAGQGTANYVVFDDKLIDILNKY